MTIEPLERMRLREVVDLGRVRPRVDRAAHQDHRGRLARIAARRQQRHRRQHRHRGLADRHDMNARAQKANKADHHIDKVVEVEPAIEQRNIPRIHPVGDEDVVVRQQGRDGAPQQGREMTG